MEWKQGGLGNVLDEAGVRDTSGGSERRRIHVYRHDCCWLYAEVDDSSGDVFVLELWDGRGLVVSMAGGVGGGCLVPPPALLGFR